MGHRVAALWHATFSIAVGALYFFFVLPRTHELMGDTSHVLGTALRIVAGALIALAALPVAFTLLRSRKPEYGTPQLALRLQTWSIVAHVLAGALIVGTAISEIWLSLDTAGQWLFGIYGAAAAIAVLGIFGFYLSLVAELPPPKPLKTAKEKKTKKEKPRRLRRKRREKATAQAEDESVEASEPKPATGEAESAAGEPPAAEPPADAEDTAAVESPGGGLRNRRPTGKSSGAHRRKQSRRGAVGEAGRPARK